MGSRGQSSKKRYASEDRRQREDAQREGARRGAKFYEYTDRNGKKTTGETGNERAQGGTYRASFNEDVARYARMSPEELERERDRLKNESDTANWGITRAAASRTGSAVDQAPAADTQIARINQVLRRQRAAARSTEAKNIPAGIRVTFPDGRTQVYAQGPNNMVMDERGLPRDVQGIRYSDLYNRMVSNQANSGVTFERITGEELSAMQAAHREDRANRPDYEFGIGTPWGNSETGGLRGYLEG